MVKKKTVQWFVIPLVASLTLFGLEGLISLIFQNISPLVKALVGFGGAWFLLQVVERVMNIDIF